MYTPTVKPLPRGRRRFVFFSLILFFIVMVPAFVFYATGYRYNFFDKDATITATGGIYLSVATTDSEVFLNEIPVNNWRVFRNAVYIQNLTPGMQRLHVQAPGLNTWVKELPVYPYIVTEAQSFSLPVVPQVRPISQFETSTGTLVFLGTSSTTTMWTGVSTTVPFILATTTATTTLTKNPEYDFVFGLFATTTATSTLLNRVVEEVSGALKLSTANSKEVGTTTTTATTSKQRDDIILSERDGDVYASYVGSAESIPYYFCVPQASLASTSAMYGQHVMIGIASVMASDAVSVSETKNVNRLCRHEIKIDRQNQEIISFDFFQSGTDLVVLHRTDGVFVVEVDDRSWQNTQPLYPYAIDELAIDNGRLYAKKGKLVFELITTLPTAK